MSSGPKLYANGTTYEGTEKDIVLQDDVLSNPVTEGDVDYSYPVFTLLPYFLSAVTLTSDKSTAKWIYTCVLAWLGLCAPVFGTSRRTIYTLFTAPKTWNEARAVCESQLGQLLKAEARSDLDEVLHLDVYSWAYTLQNMLTSGKVWNGLHSPFTANSTLEYQDCEVKSPDIALTSTDPGGRCGAFQTTDMDLILTNCDNAYGFICERFEGDCWFEPYIDMTPTAYQVWDTLAPTVEASDCAYECRHRNNSGDECWAFLYDPDQQSFGCLLYYMSDTTAQASGGTSASVFHVVPSNMATIPDMVLYVRRCFEGVVDNNVYSEFVNTDASPNTYCSYHVYPGDASENEICYCPTNEQPPIPPPVSDEALAEEYVKNLTIDNSNTSAAQRKLISAEDNRPSAVSIGCVGVVLMATTFGGLLLLDLSRLIADLKQLFTGGHPADTPTTSQPSPPDSSEC